MTTKASYQQKVHRARKRKYIYDYLSCHPCVDCGEFDPAVLDFDHVRGEKSFNFCWLTRTNISWKRIDLEIEKCDVRCSNCHRKRHAKENNWYNFSILEENKASVQSRINRNYHGTKNGYSFHKCRCDLCKKANREYQAKWRKNKVR